LLEQSGMRGGTKILSEVRMAGHTDLRPDIRPLLLRGSGCLLPTHETPSHPCSYECEQQEDHTIAWHLLSFPAPMLDPG
jgi:hypothetical protein